MNIFLILFLISWFGPSLAIICIATRNSINDNEDITVKNGLQAIGLVLIGYITFVAVFCMFWPQIKIWFHETAWGKFNDKILNKVIIHGKKEEVEDED